MNTSSCRFLVLALASLATGASLSASQNSLVTSVYSSVHNGYARHKLPDGSFQREYYALARGPYAPGLVKDASIDNVPFPGLANVLTQYLNRKNYYMAPDSKSAELLLLVSWGTTIPLDDGTYRLGLDNFLSALNARNLAMSSVQDGAGRGNDGIQSPQSAVAHAAQDQFEGQMLQLQSLEDMRRKANEHNARVLGYVDEVNYRDTPARFAGAGSSFDDLRSDLEDERYYIVISAYDFKTAKETGKRKLLWATRVSIRQQGNRFDRDLSTMLAKASRYFGQNSGHLIRQYDEGTVTVGDMKISGYEETVPPPPPEEEKK